MNMISKSNLFPILPSTIRDSRYQSLVRVRVVPTVVPSGANLISAPSYHAQGWTISDHPEGKRYAHGKAQAGITIVTEARVADPGVLDQLNAWVVVIFDMITEGNVQLQETSHLFLEMHEKSTTCNYYFADHALRTIFWLQSVDTISVRLPSSFSSGHLQHSLEENYWIHVELFPETASQYSAAALRELLVSFLHARADALTSETPTFPYSAKQSQEFIELLQCSQDNASSPYVTTYVARLWATVANHRFIIHFGEDHCRLSSDQAILEVDRKESLVLTIISNTLLFGFPNWHQARFENLWIDQLAYTCHWRKHVKETTKDLKQMMTSLFALLIANTVMIQNSSLLALTYSSLLICILALALTSVLLREQQRLANTNAGVAAVYLDDRNTKNCGFQPIAIVHSLPQAFFVWALLLFLIQVFWMAFINVNLASLLSTLIPITAILVMGSVVIFLILYPRQKYDEDTMPHPPPPPPILPPVLPLIPTKDQKERPAPDDIV